MRHKSEYEKMERQMEELDELITANREELGSTSVTKGKLEGQINVLTEQIKAAQTTDENLRLRIEAAERERAEKEGQKAEYEKQKEELDALLGEVEGRRKEAAAELASIQAEIARCNEGIEAGKSEMIDLLNEKASIKAKQQRFDTMAEQVNIRKAR